MFIWGQGRRQRGREAKKEVTSTTGVLTIALSPDVVNPAAGSPPVR